MLSASNFMSKFERLCVSYFGLRIACRARFESFDAMKWEKQSAFLSSSLVFCGPEEIPGNLNSIASFSNGSLDLTKNDEIALLKLDTN